MLRARVGLYGYFDLLREAAKKPLEQLSLAAAKKIFFKVVEPLRGGGEVKAELLGKKTISSSKKNSEKICDHEPLGGRVRALVVGPLKITFFAASLSTIVICINID